MTSNHSPNQGPTDDRQSAVLLGNRFDLSGVFLICAVVAFGIVLGSAVRANLDFVPLIALTIGLPLSFLIVRERRIVVAILCGIIYLNISNTLQTFHDLPSINKILIPGLLVVMVWMSWRRHGPKPALVVGLVIGAVSFGAAAVSLLHAQDLELVVEALNRVWKDVAVMLILAGLLWDLADIRAVAYVLIGAGMLISVLAIIAYYKADPSFEAGGLIRWLPQDRDGTAPSLRISGHVDDPNFFAQVLLIPLSLSLCFAVMGSNMWLRVISTIGFVLVACGLATTLSRGGMLAAIATLGVFCIWGLRSWYARSIMCLGIAGALILAFVLAPDGVQERVVELVSVVTSLFDSHQTPDESASGRLHEMLAAIYMFLDNPLFGVGIANYTVHFQEYSLEHGLMVRAADRAAHSLYLEVVAEQGLFGLLVFVTVLIVTFRVAIGAHRRHVRAGNQGEATVIFAVILAYTAYLMAAVLLHGVHQRFLWMLIGLMLATANIRVDPGDLNTRSR